MQSPKLIASRYCPLWVFPIGLPLKNFKTLLLGRGFHTLIKNASLFSSTDVGSHNPLLFRASVFVVICSLLQSMWDPPIYPLRGQTSLLLTIQSPLRSNVFVVIRSLLQSMWDLPIHPLGPNVLVGTPPRVYSLRGSASDVWF